MKLFELLTEGYKEVTQKFTQDADPEQVKQVIDMFRDLVNRNQVTGNEKNIDWWGKQGWENFSTFVQAKSQQKSATQIKRRKEEGKAIILEETPEWLIVVPLDRFASCFHGKDTSWCTAKPNQTYFEEYFLDDSVTLIYFINRSGEKWAMSVYHDSTNLHGGDTAEFFDVNDTVITREVFEMDTDLDSEKYETLVRRQRRDDVDIGRRRLVGIGVMIEDKLEELSGRQPTGNIERDPEIEAMLQQYPKKDLIKEYVEALYYLNNNKALGDEDSKFIQFIATFSPPSLKYFKSVPTNIAKRIIDTESQFFQYIPNPTQEIMDYALTKDMGSIVYFPPNIVNLPFLQRATMIVFNGKQVTENFRPEQIATHWLHILNYRVMKLSISFLEWIIETFELSGAIYVLLFWSNSHRIDQNAKFPYSNELLGEIEQEYGENERIRNIIETLRTQMPGDVSR